MSRSPRRLAVIGAVSALVFSGAVFAASPASAASSCYASSCTGMNPANTTCQYDAETVQTGAGDGNIQLRYSPSCRAAWARLQWSRGSGYIQVKNSNGTSYTAPISGTGSVNVYTLMVNDANITSYACYVWDGSNQWDCTNSF